ncbi:membrane protein insertase YidC [Nocardia sp. NBC_00565]|uniref:membrane protein insertase YidC n=1 Tax=Nocardia sp. NBC_00565 TaxID=2975993 RepID=UPI002E81F438|nr:membrane protein insertase YidC [Nocardia sp. NBC_00565]WUC05407.1 membrane protein insertase YidC [Nocardia sp. NBC_00565]
MLDFIYYPVSAILWVWHTAFGAVLGPASGLAWMLAVIFLVVTLRAALFLPFLKQARTQAAMQRLRPRVEEIQRKYKDDPQRKNTEIQRLFKDNGVHPFASLVPLIAQIFVFVGLFHVLRSFDRTGTFDYLPIGRTASMTAEQNAATANYLFGPGDVQSFLHAELFGAPLSATVAGAGELLSTVAIVALPIMVIAAVATHFTARAAVDRQTGAGTTQLPFMRHLTLWAFPAAAIAGGALLPVAILLYFVTNNAWTLAQQHFVYRRLDAETAAEATRVAAARVAAAPKPGAKPKRQRR